MLKKWRDREQRDQEKREQNEHDEAFNEATGHPSEKQIRKWENRELHSWLTSDELQPIERSLAERELRKREAWDGPAGRAVWTARLALVVSIISFLWAAFA